MAFVRHTFGALVSTDPKKAGEEMTALVKGGATTGAALAEKLNASLSTVMRWYWLLRTKLGADLGFELRPGRPKAASAEDRSSVDRKASKKPAFVKKRGRPKKAVVN